MTTQTTQNPLAQELQQAIDELQASLQRAAEAASNLRGLLPRVTALDALFDEVQTVIQQGRSGLLGQGAGAVTQQAYTRPTLVVPDQTPTPQPVADWSPAPAASADWNASPSQTPEQTAPIATNSPPEELTCIRLEFEASPGPLDLRAVDEAVGEHPDVRDVALLDYDGRKATLKVWIVSTASPSDVQRSLTERSQGAFAEGNQVTIVALEDAA
jgi:hypothetical protein